ncbi:MULTISPECIES: MarR family winged helix-turn-helix transcriptional regulator [Oxalobacteraceae]|jgi:DNA-binding MarR family transcriptional regulator|uniref:MarR family winged helix-turn-helix transcriptional regulator n=1 Tax=Oxalobacteraceae TaxID=75682 RepID=UPI001FFF7827|nr:MULTISPECIES: MarR family winged helix-turn-helix transcriptional regulator [Oxalobacteraceae]HJV51653.1 MarR family winged helix-turn-helix transcriptional regulator [Noviherbaspirillum sp.]
MQVLKKLRIVIRAAQRHSAWIEKQCGISGAQLWMLQELHDSPGLRVGEIAGKLAIHQTTASNLLDVLVKNGYVQKTRDPQDQRVVKLMLSKKGGDLLTKAPKPARGLLAEALGKLDQGGLSELDKGLQALLDVIEQGDDASGMQPLSFMLSQPDVD